MPVRAVSAAASWQHAPNNQVMRPVGFLSRPARWRRSLKNPARALLAAVALLTPLAALPAGSGPLAQEMDLGVVPPARFGGLKYNMVGPSRGGRVTAVAGHRAQPETFYMGATGGGLWKTTDYGQNWQPISTASLPPARSAPSRWRNPIPTSSTSPQDRMVCAAT